MAAFKNRSEDPFSSTPTKGGSVSGGNQWIANCEQLTAKHLHAYFNTDSENVG